MKTTTNGTSPKALAALLLPLVAALITSATAWAISGTFDTTAIAAAATGVGASLVAFLGGYLAPPGDVQSSFGPASDKLLEQSLAEHETHPA